MFRSAVVSGVLTALILVAGCSSSPSDDAEATGDDQEVTLGACGAVPCVAKNDFEQAKTCDSLFAAHAEIRQIDLDEGVVRWKCGDVDGVVQPELGQEYCEYHAVAVDSKTKAAIVVDNAKDLGKAKGTTVQCLYTAVYGDVRGKAVGSAGNFLLKDEATTAFDTKNVTDVAKALNASSLGPLATITAGGKSLAGRPSPGMYGKFNTRGAATTLIQDCQGAGTRPSKGADRTAACYLASKAATTAGNAAKATEITKVCAGVDLANEAAWKKVLQLGVKLAEAKDAQFENEKDIAGCLRTKEFGVPWRNSDPTICARALRASAECGTTFGELPSAAGFIDGFEMTGWNGRSLEGTGCKYVTVGGKEYRQLLLCTPPAAEVEKAITRTKRPLQQVCNDLFGNVVSMQAPIGAVATVKADAPGAKGAFCSSFNKGVSAIQKKIKGK